MSQVDFPPLAAASVRLRKPPGRPRRTGSEHSSGTPLSAPTIARTTDPMAIAPTPAAPAPPPGDVGVGPGASRETIVAHAANPALAPAGQIGVRGRQTHSQAHRGRP